MILFQNEIKCCLKNVLQVNGYKKSNSFQSIRMLTYLMINITRWLINKRGQIGDKS